jgi:hypothetical protein
LCELKRVLFCSFIRQRNDEAEVGEVIGHVFLVMRLPLNDDGPDKR